MIPRRSKVSRTTFKKLPNGAAYYLPGVTGPFHKMGAHVRLTPSVLPQTTPTLTAVADTTVAVIRVDKYFKRAQS